MYLPRHFEVTDEDQIFRFLKTHSFGQIISSHEGRLFSTHLPFLVVSEEKKLLAHLAKQNPQYKDIENQEVLITFQGPHDYISPSWFTTPGVPTWNYQAVHVYGQCRIIDDLAEIADIVDTLTINHESVFESPWQPEYRSAMLAAIVGIEVSMTEIQCKYKLSQNRVAQDQQKIIQNLEKQGANEVARAMSKNR